MARRAGLRRRPHEKLKTGGALAQASIGGTIAAKERESMAQTSLSDRKDLLVKNATDSYIRGDLDIATFEAAVARIHECADEASLDAEAAALGIAPAIFASPRGLPAVPVELECVSSALRLDRGWVKSGTYRLKLVSAPVALDLREYALASGFRLDLELDATSSRVTIIVPRGFVVENNIRENRGSVIKNKPRRDAAGDNVVTISGSVAYSVVKVKYRR
jgi:hypothetical protein